MTLLTLLTSCLLFVIYNFSGDDYQKEHGFAFGMEFNYDTDPASAPYALRGAPLGTFFSGCGSSAWTNRALQYRLELDN